jgi:hypothetical protein
MSASRATDAILADQLIKNMKLNHDLLTALTVPVVLAFHTATAPAAIFVYDAVLSGASESPPNASPGTGFALVDYDSGAHTLQVEVTFSGLLGTTTASHIHAATALPFTGTAGVATTVPTFAGFPLGVTSGSYSNTLDLTLSSSYNPSYVTTHGGTTSTAESALAAAMAAGEAYLNIHTVFVPGGEIRGFLVPVPEPSSVAIASLGAGALWMARRRMRA